MFKRLMVLVACLGLSLSGSVPAQVQTTYDGCVDASGNAVRSILDPGLDATFATRVEEGRAVIRYNPDVLPRIQPLTRLFLYASECARLNLGMAPAGPRADVDARRADCWGLTTLVRSGLVGEADIASIQSDLNFLGEEWRRIPGPVRSFDLPACYREIVDRPSLASPSAGQDDWNTCTRACGDTLFACQKNVCRGPACEPCVARYEACVSLCEFRFRR